MKKVDSPGSELRKQVHNDAIALAAGTLEDLAAECHAKIEQATTENDRNYWAQKAMTLRQAAEQVRKLKMQ